MTRIPKRLASLPEKPENGNYIFIGQFLWSHAESLSEAYKIWSGSGGNITEDLAVLDVSDDFTIYHVDGSVSATTVRPVFRQGCYESS